MADHSIVNVRGYMMVIWILTLSSCSLFRSIPVEPIVSITTKEILPPKPIMPEIDRLSLRKVGWVIITPENVDEIFASIKDSESKSFFAFSAEGYDRISLNLGDLRSLVEQQRSIILSYEKLWNK